MGILWKKNEVVELGRGIYGVKRIVVENMMGMGVGGFLMKVGWCFMVIVIKKGLKV